MTMFDTGTVEIVFGCNSRRVAGGNILRGEHAYGIDYSSRYAAIGRFREGHPEDGFSVAGQILGRADTGTGARERSPSQSISQGWKSPLVAGSGNSETVTDTASARSTTPIARTAGPWKPRFARSANASSRCGAPARRGGAHAMDESEHSTGWTR